VYQFRNAEAVTAIKESRLNEIIRSLLSFNGSMKLVDMKLLLFHELGNMGRIARSFQGV
jgi:hypothetical protein